MQRLREGLSRLSPLAGVICVAVGVPMLVSADMPWWWFGAGLIAGGLYLAYDDCRRAAASDGWLGELWSWGTKPRDILGFEALTYRPAYVALEMLVLLIIAGIVVGMAPELVMGERPVSFDHPVHYMKAWRLENEFLWEGRFRGWSHQWFAGYPAQYLYPIGADTLVVAIHWLTLGFASLGTAYAWALALFWLLRGWVMYRFAAMGAGRWGGLLAALLWMTDTAASRIGGWHFAMDVGVWPMSLSVVLGLWATAWLSRLVTEGKPRHLAGFGLLLGLALVTHPLAVFQFALIGPVTLVVAWFARDALPWLQAAWRVCAGYAVGILFGLVWMLPLLTSSAAMDSNFGGRWRPMYEMGVSLYQTGLLQGTWAWITVIGAVGVVACLVARRFHTMLTGWIALSALVLASTDFLAAFHLLEWLDTWQSLHFKRYVAILKPFWIAAAVYLLVGAGRQLREATSQQEGLSVGRRRLQTFMGAFFVVTALAPISVGFGGEFVSRQMNRDLQTVTERPTNPGRAELDAWFESNHPNGSFDGGEFFRVAYCCSYHDHSFVDFGARIPFPIYKIGYSPATSFEHRIKSGERPILEALNVRYLIAPRPENRSYLEKIGQFGRYHLYEFSEWNRRPVSIRPPGTREWRVPAEDNVSVEQFGRERIVLEVSQFDDARSTEDGETGELRVNVSNFSRWEAWRGDQWLSITETSLPEDKKTGFMTVPLESGRYVFEFERSWSDWAAWLCGLIALLLIIGLARAELGAGRAGKAWNWLNDRIREYSKAWSREIRIAGVVGVVVAALFASGLAWFTPAIQIEHVDIIDEEVESVAFDAADQISDAQVAVMRRGNLERCRQLFGRFICSQPLWKQPHARVEDFGFDYKRYRCIWTHPVDDGPTHISYSDVPIAEGMIGFFGVAESGSKAGSPPVELTVAVDGIERYTSGTKQDETLHGFSLPLGQWTDGATADVTFKVSAERTGMRHFCFNAQTVQIDGDGVTDVRTRVPDIPRAKGLRP